MIIDCQNLLVDDKQTTAYTLDGGFGSCLEACGYNVNKHALWSGGANIEKPELVERVHQMFIDAGAEILMTNTYHCCIKKLGETRNYSVEQGEELIAKAVDMAKRAIVSSGKDVILLGSIGPYATYLRDASEYSGSYVKKPDFNDQTIIDYYLQQSKPLIKAGIKYLVFETIPTLKEVECLGKVLELLDDDVKAWIVVTCEDGKRTRSGDLFSDVVKLVNTFEKAVAVGINCTSPLYITELLQSVQNCKQKPMVVYPNSGEVYNPENRKFEGDSEIDMITGAIPEWYALGVRVFGGCCRVMPEHIAEIAKACRKLKRKC